MHANFLQLKYESNNIEAMELIKKGKKQKNIQRT